MPESKIFVARLFSLGHIFASSNYMDAQLAAKIEIAEALWKQTIILGKTRDPRKKIAAGEAEIEAKEKLDRLQLEAGRQMELREAVSA